MIFFNKEKIITEAETFLKEGFFQRGYQFLKKKKIHFFIFTKSTQLRKKYFFLMGAFLYNKGYYRKAAAYLKMSLFSLSINPSEIFFLLIKSYIKLDNPKKTKYYFKKLLDRSFNPFYILYSYYECKKNKIELELELESLEDMMPFAPDTLFDKLTYSLFYLLKEEYQKAYNILSPDKFKYSNTYYYSIIFLKVLFRLKKYEEIIEYYKKNIKALVSIESLDIYSATLYKLKLWNQCLKVLEEYIELQNFLTTPYVNCGKIYLIKKNYIQAIDFFKNALNRSKKGKEKIYFLLSISYQRIGLLNDALKYANKIPEDSPIYQKLIFNLALLYYDIGKMKQANNTFAQLDKENLPVEKSKYFKWRKIISNMDNNKIIERKLNLLIRLIPVIILIFTGIISIIFYLITLNFL